MDRDDKLDFSNDDFDPKQDNDSSPGQWMDKAMEIFFSSSTEGEIIEKLYQLADMHPLAIGRLKIGMKDLGMEIPNNLWRLLDKLQKKSIERWSSIT